ncbi:amine sulfotransferase-like [Rhincodon typus]|uniref:amine sulfotransferase-like n=1 Tax=Rhincodon typus TaxID=259920 RepID=UPI002030B3AB|nr:amine sulfotransferase-like [Rhincodon typus]
MLPYWNSNFGFSTLTMSHNYDLFEYKNCNFISNIHTTEYLEELTDTEIRDSDVIAITYPKSGTVWMQQILTLIFSNGDLAAVQNKLPEERVPWVEVPTMCFLTQPSPRLAVSHLPYHLIPEGLKKKTGKVIYVYRNPKDVFVSLYHFQNYITLLNTPPGFDEFLEKFLEGKVIYSSWFDHIQNWYTHRNKFNILFLSYEELKLVITKNFFIDKLARVELLK